jgi:hypothetical protein
VMPIRPDQRQFYGPEHRRYRAALIAVHGARCFLCKAETPKYLNLAHLQRDPASYVIALLCPRCHGAYDALWNRSLARRTIAKRVGQLWLLPELEWAPVPSRLIPRSVLEAAQGRLF